MKIQYLGTAAAEAVPAFFCACPHCEYARAVGGKEVRTRCGAIVDDTIKLDFPPDTLLHMFLYGLNFNYLEHLLITHSHEDHFCWNDIAYRREGFSHPAADAAPLNIYGDQVVVDKIKELNIDGLVPHLMVPFVPTKVGEYTVTALKAVHMIGSSEQPLFYLIEKDGQSLLYAHDTDEFPQEDIDFLANKHIGLISLDCTNAVKHYDYVGHMDIWDNLAMRKKLLANGAADEKTIFVANHFSHNGLAPYEELEKAGDGMLISYDGMEVEF